MESVGLSIAPTSKYKKGPWDAVYTIQAEGLSLDVALYTRSTAEPRRVYELVGQFQLLPEDQKKVYPLFFAPYVSQRAAALCREAGIGCFDETGNCWIKKGNLIISSTVENKQPAPRRRSRHLFAPKSLRVIRALLCTPLKGWRQIEFSEKLSISLGLVNRIVRRLLDGAYITIIEGRIYLKDRKSLLNEWVRAEAVLQKTTTEYYSAEPLSLFEERLDALSARRGFQYALTLFSGAKYRAPFTRINRLHAYVLGDSDAIARELAIKPVPSGGNIVLIPIADEGVLYETRRVQNRNIVSDVQLYVDLKNAHGRGDEQAEALAERCLQALVKERSIEQEAKLHEFLHLRDKGDALLFQHRDAMAAVIAYNGAMESISYLDPLDKHEEIEFFLIKLWLARLNAAFFTKSNQLFDEANSVFSSKQEQQEALTHTGFNNGWIKYGMMLEAAMESKWSDPAEKRAEAKQRFDQLYMIVTSPYTESSNELTPRAQEVRRWIDE